MSRLVTLFLAVVIFTSLAVSQDLPAPTPPAEIAHGAFAAMIVKTLDSSRLKEDDVVEVETNGSFKLPDGTLVPKGSKLMARVVTAKARSKGDADSELTLAFNKLELQNGRSLSLKGIVQAIYPPAEEEAGPNMATAGTSSGGSARGNGGDATGLTNTKSGMETQSSSSGEAVVDVKAQGAQGIRDLSLNNGVISSKGKNVKLAHGMRLVVRADILGQERQK